MGSGAEGEAEENLHPEAKKKTPKQVQPKTIFPQESPEHKKVNKVPKSRPEPPLKGAVAVTDYTVAADLQDLEAKTKSMMEHTERNIFSGNRNRRVMVCKVCGKEGQLADVQRHIEANHITGVSHSCNICGKTSRSSHGLSQRVYLNHRQGRD